MKEPQKYSMETGEPVKEEIKKYPLNSIHQEESNEQVFLNFIQKAKESRRKYNERLEKIRKENGE